MTGRFHNAFSRPATLVAIGVASMNCYASDDVIPVEKFQPAITVEFAPEKPNGWELERPMVAYGMNLFSASVPSYDGKGKLISSWTPQHGKVFDRPTVILVHGGHGVSPANIDMAVWVRKELKANVLILDSYWSRGRTENWLAWTEYGANMRVLDLIAGARFTQSQGADPKKTFVIGGSQGGWTVLRAFSNHNLSDDVKSLLVGGASLYPNCYVKESIFGRSPSGTTDKQYAPPLGNYVAPVIAFTGTDDTATPLSQCNTEKVFKGVEKWTNFEGATHAWDSPSGGIGKPGLDGICSKALNKYNQFPVCRNNKYTDVMRNDILAFVERHLPNSIPSPAAPTSSIQPTPTDSIVEQRTEEILREMAGASKSVSRNPTTLWQGPQSGRVEFDSLTPPDRWQFVRKVMDNTKPAKVYGDLLLPRKTSGKMPAVLISHDSGGVTAKLYDVWANELNNAGVAVFIIDSFKPRGIDSTTNNQGQVDVSANVADALYGLKLLATHPQIDAKRIFHMGGSRGGTAVFETYWDMVRKAVITDDLKFAGHIPLYQGNCNTRFRFDRGNTNKAPMLALMGGADDGTPADACITYYTELNRAGANIKWKVFPDTFHGFDGSSARTYLPQGVTAKNCSIEVFLTDVKGGGLGEARDYKTGTAINGFGEWNKAFAACNSRGFTIASNGAATDQAVKDVIEFVKRF